MEAPPPAARGSWTAILPLLAVPVALMAPVLAVGLLAVPVLVAGASRVRHDAVGLLTAYLCLLLLIPSRLIFSPLGASGTPANIIGILALIWWIITKVLPDTGGARGRQPMHTAIGLFVASVLASYVAACLRAAPPIELSGATRGLLTVAGAAGVALLVADGITDRESFDLLLRRLVALTTFVALLGILQFATGYDLSTWFRIPGLKVNYALDLITERSSFRRVAGTASHPIEFGVAMALVFPLALHDALHRRPERAFRPWLCVASIGFAMAVSLSRAAFVAMPAALLVVFPTWDGRRKLNALAVTAVALGAIRVMVPGLLGTLVSLFTNFGTDPSTTARLKRYGIAGHYLKMSPWLGRGYGTWIPPFYQTFDMQYLVVSVELGLVGLAVVAILLGTGFFSARGARRHSTDPETRALAQTIAGCVLGSAVALATFDAFSFPMAMGLIFFILGCSGALWRLTLDEARSPSDAVPVPAPPPPPVAELVGHGSPHQRLDVRAPAGAHHLAAAQPPILRE